jgi:hypothetical protein
MTLMLLTFVGLGMAWRQRPLADLTDKHANKAIAAQANIEESDIPQMVSAANEYRRKRGRPEVTVADYRAAIGAEQAAILDEANKQLRAKRMRRPVAARREARGF